ncbi:MAG: hypothetical protein JSV74_05850 [Dehalococcoidia bacterium]|nr:MAG: hypothetical protein JSV74_05850 [Dehalococcoidia bacterium]
MQIFKGFKLHKKYTIFFAVIPLLLATSLYSADCPICQGTGVIESSPVMEYVKIEEYKARPIKTTPDACGLYLLYKYDILISLVNESSDDAEGWLKLTLVDTLVDRMIDEQYVEVSINGLTIFDTKYTLWFGSSLGTNTGIIETSGQLEVFVEVLLGEVPCVVCDATGRIPLHTTLFVNGLKDTFTDIVRTEQIYQPPKAVDWENFFIDAP